MCLHTYNNCIYFILIKIVMVINCKILTFLQDYDKNNKLFSFNCKNNCLLFCDIFQSYLELYKQIVIKDVSTSEKSVIYNKNVIYVEDFFNFYLLNIFLYFFIKYY